SVLHDGSARFPNDTWKGAGVAIPVFSLRRRNSFGVGEVADIQRLVDWPVEAGLQRVAPAPVNDSTPTQTRAGSYPCAAIAAFALHPQYINLAKVAGKKYADKISPGRKKQKHLNEKAEVDYEEVMRFKMALLKELYEECGKECIGSEDYLVFFNANKHWLIPYAAFCYFRDKYQTAHYDTWKTNSVYNAAE